jgi:hypothetical protein
MAHKPKKLVGGSADLETETTSKADAGASTATRAEGSVLAQDATEEFVSPDDHPEEVHLSLEPDAVRVLVARGGVRASHGDSKVTGTSVVAPNTEGLESLTPEDVALDLEGEDPGVEIQPANETTDDVSDADNKDDDDSRTSDGDQADDEDGTSAEEKRARRAIRKQSHGQSVATSGYETPPESPTRSPRSSDASGAFATAMRSPAAFLQVFSRGMRLGRKEKHKSASAGSEGQQGNAKGEENNATGDVGDGVLVADGETTTDRDLQTSKSHNERRRDKRKAKKARRRLKRLVHHANTMGAVVEAKEQTTTQLALCMQLGLSLSFRGQKMACEFADVSDEALTENDTSRVLEVAGAKVTDGSRLPSFRFITHAPSRFERVRAAWGLSLNNYAESFELETKKNPETASGENQTAEAGEAGAARLVTENQPPPTPTRKQSAGGHHKHTTSRTSVGSKSDVSYSNANSDDDDDEAGGKRNHANSFFDAGGNLARDTYLPKETSLRIISSEHASGKSSSWFFCSKDSRFLVKTCTQKEMQVLLDILGEYSAHAQEHRGTSLLPQYYGVYSIQVGSRSAHFIIMNYWFATMHEISKRFDLKGSTKGRSASAKEKAKGSSAVLKDLDFLQSGLRVENPLATNVMNAIAIDVAFMERNRLIDYSMMVGLHFYGDQPMGVAQSVEGVGVAGASHEKEDGKKEKEKKQLTSGSDGNELTSGGEDSEAPPGARSPGRRRRRHGYGSFGSGQVSVVSDFGSPPATPKGGRTLPGGFEGAAQLNSIDSAAEIVSNDFTGPFAEPAADDTRLQFQLRALETPFGLAYLGIIDILTQYGAVKVAENLCLGKIMCGADISCQPPDQYAKRFKRFIDENVLQVPNDAKRDSEDTVVRRVVL